MRSGQIVAEDGSIWQVDPPEAAVGIPEAAIWHDVHPEGEQHETIWHEYSGSSIAAECSCGAKLEASA